MSEDRTNRTFARPASELPAIRVVTYNIHGCVGLDRRCDPARIATVLREIDADIACLQEVDARGTGFEADQAAYLGEATGREVILGAPARERRGRFANAILTRFPRVAAHAIDLAVPGYEPRGAIDVDILAGHRLVRVIATHFGLHAGERQLQANRVIAALGEPATPSRIPPHAVLLVGDLNEWRGRGGGGIRALDRCLGPSAMPRTFPSWMPVLPLDRIYAFGPAALYDVCVYRSAAARIASDHLPLVGEVWWGDHAAPRGRRARRRFDGLGLPPRASRGAVMSREAPRPPYLGSAG